MREIFLPDHLQKEEKKNLAICLVSIGSSLAFLVIGIAMGVALVMVLGAGALVVSGFIVTKHGPACATYRCGMQGERVLRDHLRSLRLSDEHTAYYNLPVNGNGRISDIDCVLTGPFGLFVFEVKHHRGLVFYRNGIWAQIKVARRGNIYAGHLGNPSAQLSRNIRTLKARLERSGWNAAWFQGAIIFTNSQAVLDIEGLHRIKAVAVKDLYQIVSRKTMLSTKQVERINTCLSASLK